MRMWIVAVIAVPALALTACGGEDPQIANPASVFCDEQGGTVEIREDAEGGQRGFCVFPDGSECDEWAFYRQECAPGEAASPDVPAGD